MKKRFKIFASMLLFILLFNITITSFALENVELKQNTIVANKKNGELEQAISIDEEEKKIENEDIIEDKYPESMDAKNGISTFNIDSYEGTIIEGKGETALTYVQRDGKNYTYSRENVLTSIRLKRYCFETGEYINIFDSWNKYDVQSVFGYYVQGKVIYTAFYPDIDEDILQILGYDTQTEQISYDKTFEIPYEIFHGDFVVSQDEFVYITTYNYNETDVTISSYNAEAELIDSTTQTLLENYQSIDVTGVKNDNSVLFLSLKTYPNLSGTTWWDDYVIKMDEGNFIDNNSYRLREKGGIIWKFLDESQTHAYTQYGELYEIDYNANNEAGIEYNIKKSIDIKGESYASTPYLAASDDTYLYIGAQKGMLYILNWHNAQIEKSLCIGENKIITGVYKKSDEELLIEYYDSTTYSPYALSLSISDYNEVNQNILLTEHTSLTRSKLQIKNKYDELSIVNKTSDIYEVTPSTTVPYTAGSLKQQTKTDTINQINYFRWLTALNPVVQNDEYMDYSQKGAVVLAANNILDHNPTKPSGMDEIFYSEGYDATSAGIGTSANISAGTLMAYSIKGYIDDVYNISNNVGHRLSLLDKNAESVSFGYADGYGVVNIFTNNTITNDDIYHAWPSPGNFPVESIDSEAMWSIELPEGEIYADGSRYIVLKANGKEYTSGSEDSEIDLYIDTFYNTYFFNIPEEVKQYLTDGTNDIQEGKTVEIEVHGFADSYGNTYIIKYPINFFSLDNVLTDISLPETITLTQGTTKNLELIMTPENAKPEGTIQWSSDSPNIASISEDGTITAETIGEAIITARLDGLEVSTKIKVVEAQMGDVNKDSNIDMLDYVLILSHVRGTKLLTGDFLELADVNSDGIVDMLDYVLVLSHVRGTKLLY